MATIPLQLAQRRLDAGAVVQYPNGSPVGEAMQGFGGELSAVAERYRQQKEQQEAFDAEVVGRQLGGQIAQAEVEAVHNAPADGSGLHDAMYGQVDPRTGGVIKPGLFDTLFDSTLPKVPESQRANFIGRKEVLRSVGSARMAAQQQARRDGYEQAEWTKVDNFYTGSIARSDPNDTATFEAIRQSGFDFIAKIGNPLARQAAEAAWRGNTAKALVQAMIAQDPKRAAEMLGGAPASDGISETVRMQPGAASQGEQAAVKGDRVGKLSPDERIAHAFGGTNSTPPGDKTAIDAISYLKPGDVASLRDQASVATATQLIDARTSVDLASQDAAAVIASTGTYPERMPSPQDFTAVYGAEEGGRRLRAFDMTVDIGRQIFDMRPVPNQAIHAKLRDFEPGPNSSQEEREQYEIKVGAAKLVLSARRSDPAGYVSQLYKDKAPDWSKVSTSEDYKTAITWAVAAQQQMGFETILPLPQSSADDLATKFVDPSVKWRQRITNLSAIFLAVRDPRLRIDMARQLFRSGLPRLHQNAADEPKLTPADIRAREDALATGLLSIAQNPARAQYDAMPFWLQPLVAADDVARLMAKGATIGHADKISAGLNSLFSDKSYEELLAAERTATEDAEDRAGSAGMAAEFLGAAIAGHGLSSAGVTLSGRFGTAAMDGLSGLTARTALAAGEGAIYGAAYAHGQDQDMLSGAAAGALWGTGGNILAEGVSTIGRQVAARLAKGSETAKAPVSAGTETVGSASAEAPELLVVDGEIVGEIVGDSSAGYNLHLFYMPHWTDIQRAAADLKVRILTESETIVTRAVRVSESARRRFTAAGHEVPAGSHVDHTVDLQLGGGDHVSNMAPLDASVNTSLGSQIHHRIKNLPLGTKINKVTIGDHSVRDIPKKLSGG